MKMGVKIGIIIGIIILLIIAVTIYIFVFKKSPGLNIPGIDYSAGSGVGNDLDKATDTNVFSKLNPFRE